MKHLSLLAACILCAGTILAQPAVVKEPGKPESFQHELYIGTGLLSGNQLRGLTSDEPMSSFMSFPNGITGALFVTYRQYVASWFAVGVAAGTDNQWGELSYGDEHHGNFPGYKPLGGVSGHYARWAYTIAAEGLFTFMRERSFTMGGYVGVGYTLASTKYVFAADAMEPEFFYGAPGSIVPSSPYTRHYDHAAFQLTPLSIRAGNAVAGFFELGYGYKGIISGGVSARL